MGFEILHFVSVQEVSIYFCVGRLLYIQFNAAFCWFLLKFGVEESDSNIYIYTNIDADFFF